MKVVIGLGLERHVYDIVTPVTFLRFPPRFSTLQEIHKRGTQNRHGNMVDLFLIVSTVVAFFILFVIAVYLLVHYQHPDDHNEAYIPKLVVIGGIVLAGATALLLPLDVANNEGYAGKLKIYGVLRSGPTRLKYRRVLSLPQGVLVTIRRFVED